MAAADFPSSPTVGQTYSNNGRTWTYTSAGIWDTTNTGTIAGDIAVTGNATIQGNETVDGSVTAANYSMAGKNVIINGGFDIAQRGTGAFTAIGWSLDRWKIDSVANTNLYRDPLSTYAPSATGSKYSLTIYTTSATNSLSLSQPLESRDVALLKGKTVTLSFYASANTNCIVGFQIQGSSTADSSSATFTTLSSGALNASVTTTWTRFSITTTIPANSTTDGLRINFATWNNPSGTLITLSQVQLELGSVATPFSRAGGTIAGELVNCMYYYAYFPNLWGTVGADGYWATVGIPHAAYMRATPVGIVDVVNTPASGGNIGTNISLNMSSKTMGYFHPSSPPGGNTWLNFAGVKLDAEL